MQIADAIKRFGISPSTTTLLLVRIGSPTKSGSESATQEDIEAYQQRLVDEMAELVDGDMVSLQELPNTSDWKAIKKVRNIDTRMERLEQTLNTIHTNLLC